MTATSAILRGIGAPMPILRTMREARPPVAVVKHSLTIAGHRTSVSLEAAFWRALGAIAAGRGTTLPLLVAAIDKDRAGNNLSSALRVFVLEEMTRRAGLHSGA